MTHPPFPVLCDRCHAEGLAGEAEFERLAGLGDLLDFEPVPRRTARADGWTPEIQRAFVAALAVTGSDRQAAAVVGRAAFGVTQLRRAEGNESFLAACAKALEIHGERERVRRSDNLLAAARGDAARRGPGRPRLAWSNAATRRPPPEPAPTPIEAPPAALEIGEALEAMDDQYLETLVAVVRKYRMKLEAERRCRLEGRIAEADFYLRQITMLEVAMDVVGGNGMEVLKKARLGEYGLLDIAETGMSIFLDGARRQYWDEQGAPPRPEYPPHHLLEQHDGFATEPLTTTLAFYGEGAAEKRSAIDEQCARDARAQVEWEAEALRDYERRRESDAVNNQEPGEAGQPAPNGDRTDVTKPPS
jgi:hypothetical protein